ncbi:MAG: PilZ domain-containing protein [Clostridia bacterium]|jgi:c-di-GMP-binding flagellar brake protein YcgR|nr:PilZ domain-containing protein [Spirochaetia bacterium]
MENERRREQRFKMAQMIAYDMGREQYIKAKAVDISKGGIGFISDDFVDPLVTVWLSFSLPVENGKWHSVESEGYVVDVRDHEDGCRFGVSFSRMDEGDRAILHAYLARLQAESAANGDSDSPS